MTIKGFIISRILFTEVVGIECLVMPQLLLRQLPRRSILSLCVWGSGLGHWTEIQTQITQQRTERRY